MRKKRRWGRRVVVGLVVLVVAAVAAGAGTAAWADAKLHRVAVFSDYDGRPAAGRGTNWLLVGTDSREGLTPSSRPSCPPAATSAPGAPTRSSSCTCPAWAPTSPATMVSIPRDSYVDIPGYGSDKINAAYVDGGPALLAQTVEEATGLRLDHYAEVGFGGFPTVVDALGGVEVCPAEPISDPLAGIDLPAGCQTLDGRNALGYVRSRATRAPTWTG